MTTDLSQAINDVIERRTSLYPHQYDPGASVPDEIIRQVLHNANHAPNHKRTEPWRFTVFTGAGLKKFADFQFSMVQKHEPEASGVKLKKLAEFPLMASHIIAIGMKRNAEKVPEIEEVLAVGCAIQNIFLTTTAYGLAGYLSTGGVTYIEEAKEFFGLSAEDKLIGFFYIGKKKDMDFVVKSRGPVDEKITWVRE